MIARFDEYWERCHPSSTPQSAALVDRIGAAWRAENRAAAAQLVAIGELFGYRLSRCSNSEEWAIDTEEAVTAEVAAALRISRGLASSRLRYARAMREQLPKVAEVFTAGEIDYRMFQTMVYRTDLITDRDVLAAVDAQLAVQAPRWPSMTQGRLAGQIDKIVARADADAVRRAKERHADREVWIGDLAEGGISQIHGSLVTVDAHALDKRLDGLAATVCEHDPRTRQQRRADALGALAAGADRLGCRCGRPDCPVANRPAASPVVIHVIAEHATIDGQVSYELANDTPTNLLSFLVSQAAQSLALGASEYGDDLINDDGNAKPSGLLTGAATGVTGPAGTGTSLGTQGTADEGSDALWNLIGSVAEPYANAPSAAFLMRNASDIVVRKLRDTIGRPVAGLTERGRILGYPVFHDPFMPAMANAAESIAFGDMSKYFVRIVNGVRFERSDDRLPGRPGVVQVRDPSRWCIGRYQRGQDVREHHVDIAELWRTAANNRCHFLAKRFWRRPPVAALHTQSPQVKARFFASRPAARPPVAGRFIYQA